MGRHDAEDVFIIHQALHRAVLETDAVGGTDDVTVAVEREITPGLGPNREAGLDVFVEAGSDIVLNGFDAGGVERDAPVGQRVVGDFQLIPGGVDVHSVI